MSMPEVAVTCRYAPIELFAGFGASCRVLDAPVPDTGRADTAGHANLCGFGKAVIQQAAEGGIGQLVLMNCCDVMRRAFEVSQAVGELGFARFVDLPRTCGPCQVDALAASLMGLRDAYAEHCGRPFDLAACQAAFSRPERQGQPYVGIMGVRVGTVLRDLIERSVGLPVRDLTCTGGRDLAIDPAALATDDEGAFFRAYAQALLGQTPCRRMADASARRRLFEDPNLRGIIYHTMKFCDFYGPEYAEAKRVSGVPVLKIESDFTLQSAGQLATRIEAFAETLGAGAAGGDEEGGEAMGIGSVPEKRDGAVAAQAASGEAGATGAFVAGIDSGSTSTDVVIMDLAGNVVASRIIPTGAGAARSAEACLAQALEAAGIGRGDVRAVVATGYGRAYIDAGDATVTEITCHALGARRIDPEVSTVIDIGGQDIKAIRIDESGNVADFAMNDKCAAGTGRFLEMMARALELDMETMAGMGLECDEQVTISSMCSVFAESEVVSLVARSIAPNDIVHGIDESVAAKVATLVHRVGGKPPFMLTGGVAKNRGVVAALERKLGHPVAVSGESQLAGAIGAALLALKRVSRAGA